MGNLSSKRRGTLIILIIMLGCLSLASYTPEAMAKPHNPIKITGNHLFNAPNGVLSGKGTAAEPFVIEDWVINASTANGIEVSNTNFYFVIRNCTIIGSPDYHGIYFYDVENGAIEGCTIYGGMQGILLNASSACVITGNNITGNSQDGIRLEASQNSTVKDNAVSGNGAGGIAIGSSNGSTVSNNTLSGNAEYGIGVASSTNSTLKGNNLAGSEVGIFLGFNSSSALTNNTVSYCSYGVSVYNSSNNITGGVISANDCGIYLENATGNVVANCSIYGNTGYGVYNKQSSGPAYVADAAHCWWGSADGPSGVGPGSGDAVSPMVDYDPWLTAPWGQVQEYYVIIESSEGGTTNPAAGGWYEADDVVFISATPSANYTFANWTATGGITVANPSASTTTFRVTGAGTLRANFARIVPSFTVSFQSTPGGTTNPSGNKSYQEGASTTIRATASQGHKFTGWAVVGNATVSNLSNATTTLTVYGNASVTALFQVVIEYAVSFSHSFGGITAPSGSANYEANSVINITSTPDPGYRFENWTVVGNLTVEDPYAASTTLTVNGSGIVYAYFSLLDLLPPAVSGLTPTPGSTVSGGSVSIAANFSDETGIDASSVSLEVDGAPATGLQVNSAGFTYSTTLQPGNHSVVLTVNDTKGNSRTATWSFTVAPPAFPMEYVALGIAAIGAAAAVAFYVIKKKPFALPRIRASEAADPNRLG